MYRVRLDGHVFFQLSSLRALVSPSLYCNHPYSVDKIIFRVSSSYVYYTQVCVHKLLDPSFCASRHF